MRVRGSPMITAAERLAQLFPEVEPMAYYRQLFPSELMEEAGQQVEGLYTAIAISVFENSKGEAKAQRCQITKGLPQLPGLIEGKRFSMTAPVLFAGRRAANANARYLTALEFDLDYLRVDKGELQGIEDFLYQTSLTTEDPFNRLPTPTYVIASSERNLHVVYLLDEPLPLYKFTLDSVRNYRRGFIPKLWNSWITEQNKKPQFETSPVQAFRLVGSKTKQGNAKVRCFQTGARVSVDYMNNYSPNKILTVKSELTLEQAKELYPEWYEYRIVKGLPKRTWECPKGLYDWWLDQLPNIEVGHRYHFMLCLAAYAQKCGVSHEQLKKDMAFCREELDKISPPNNPLLVSDMEKALQAHQERFRTLPRAKISELSGLEIPQAKRNYRPQTQHMLYLNGMNAVKRSMGEEFATGRPNKAEEVKQYILDHLQDNVSKLARGCGVSRPTIYKYLKELKDDQGQAKGKPSGSKQDE